MLHKTKNNISSVKANPNGWLVIMADLISIIITFFVLVYSMSDIRPMQWQEMSSTISSFINGNSILIKKRDINSTKSAKIESVDIKRKEVFSVEYIEAIIGEPLDKSLPVGFLNIVKEEESVKFVIDIDKLFDYQTLGGEQSLPVKSNSPNPRLSSQGEELLYIIGNFLPAIGNVVEVNIINTSEEQSLKLADFIAGKLYELGYEYNILKGFSSNLRINTSLVEIIVRNKPSYL